MLKTLRSELFKQDHCEELRKAPIKRRANNLDKTQRRTVIRENKTMSGEKATYRVLNIPVLPKQSKSKVKFIMWVESSKGWLCLRNYHRC